MSCDYIYDNEDGERVSCGRTPGRRLRHLKTLDEMRLCRTHFDRVTDADPDWVDVEVLHAMRTKDAALVKARSALWDASSKLSAALERMSGCIDAKATLEQAARNFVTAENARKEILR